MSLTKIFLIKLIFFAGFVNAQLKNGIIEYGVKVPANEKTDRFFNSDYNSNVNNVEYELIFNLNEASFNVIDKQFTQVYDSKSLTSSSKGVGFYYKNL